MADSLKIQKVKQQVKKDGGKPKIRSVLPPNASEPQPVAFGEKYAVCECCGEAFERPYIKKTNSYMNYKYCPSCRKPKKNKEVTYRVATVDYSPFPWQIEAEENLEKCRYEILACGARTGKDRYSIMMIIKYCAEMINERRHITKPELVPPIRIWYVAPNYGLADQGFRELKHFFPKAWTKSYRDSDRQIELQNGGIIEVKSAYNKEDLVAVGIDFCVITEADRVKDLDDVWSNISMRLVSPGRGREKDRVGNAGCGKCIMNSSPTKKGFFYELYKRGLPDADEHDTDYISMNEPSTANPFVKEELDRVKHTKYGDITQFENLRRTWSPERFARDILGQFVDSSGAVFTEFRKKCVIDLYSVSTGFSKEQRDNYIKEWQRPISGHTYRIGYDPATGASSDDPAVVVRDMVSNRIVFQQNLYGKNYDQQYDAIAYISRRYNYANCCWLRTGHTPVENQLAKRGVLEVPINEAGGNKAQFVESLSRAVQNGDVKVLEDGSDDNQKLIRQMEDYTEMSSGKYSNSLESHDDFVSAMYAVYHDYSDESTKNYYFSTTIMNL